MRLRATRSKGVAQPGRRPDTGLKLVTHGDSISSVTHPTSDPTKNWSRLLAAAITARTGQAVNHQQYGIGGHSWKYAWAPSGNPNTLMQDAVINIDPHVSASARLCLFAGTNGLTLNGKTPAAEAADADEYIAARLAAGWVASNIYVLTMLPREGYSDARRTEYCLALETICQARGLNIVRLHEDNDIGLAGVQSNTTFFPDQIHPTPLGHEVVAETVYDVMVPTAWTPVSLANAGRITLAVHLDAQDAATLFTDTGSTQAAENDLVYTWQDKSGGARHAIQATSTGRGVKKTFQGKPAIQFGGWGSGDFMQSATHASGLPSANTTMLIAVATDVTGGNHQMVETSTNNAAVDTGISIKHQSGWLANVAGGSNQGGNPNWAAPFGWTTAAISLGSRSGHLLINGARGVSGAGGSPAQATGYRIAAPYGVTGFQFGGYFGEMIWLGTQALAIDMQRLIKYMHARWAISARPAPVQFNSVTGAIPGATITSNTVTVSGLGTGVGMRFSMTNRAGLITGVEYSINGGAWVAGATSARLVNGDTVQIRRPASSTSGQTREDEIHWGPSFIYWSVTTA